MFSELCKNNVYGRRLMSVSRALPKTIMPRGLKQSFSRPAPPPPVCFAISSSVSNITINDYFFK